MKIYTDDSKIGDKVGAAFVVLLDGETIKEHIDRLRDHSSVFQALKSRSSTQHSPGSITSRNQG